MQIARQRPVLQAAPADQTGERLAGGHRQLMAPLAAPLPQTGEPGHVTPRARLRTHIAIYDPYLTWVPQLM